MESYPGLCSEIEKLAHGIRLDERLILFLSDKSTSDHTTSFLQHLAPQDELIVFRVERGSWRLSEDRQTWLRGFLSSDQ